MARLCHTGFGRQQEEMREAPAGKQQQKRRCRMGDSRIPANRRGLQVHGARLRVRCHSAANSTWSPGRAGAWIVQGINYSIFLSLLDSFGSLHYGAQAGVYQVMWLFYGITALVGV